MQMEKKDIVDPPGSPINGLRCSDLGNNPVMAFSGPSDQYGKDYCLDNPECFYDKLSGLYESSGLNLILNVRETLLNLHVFYKEVTERGGYYQVTKDKRWEEVAIGMKLEGVNVKYPQQLQKVYALFLFQFEQIYFYRASEKVAADSGHIFNLGITPPMKRKSSVTLPQILVEEKDVNFRTARKMLKDKSHPVFTGGTVEQKLSPATPSKTKEMEKHSSRGRPRRIRTAYQIFIKSECERLRRTHGEKLKGQGQNFRVMADQVWRNLSESDRQPYIEESIKDKELYCQELHAQNENQNKEDPKVHSEGDYHVKPEFEKEPPAQLPDHAVVDLAVEIMNNNTPAESILQNVQDN